MTRTVRNKTPAVIKIRHRDEFGDEPVEAEVWIGMNATMAEVTTIDGLTALVLRGITLVRDPLIMQGSVKRAEPKRRRCRGHTTDKRAGT